jgi:cytochrome c-type biogenesis protein CcmH/NrfG
MPEPILLLIGLALAGAAVLPPLWSGRFEPTPVDDEHEAAAVRHRVALEALRDVGADRRAGSLDDATYAAQLAEAEERAAATRAELGRERVSPGPRRSGHGRTAAVVVAGILGLGLLGGSLVPATGIAGETVVNEQLAAARDAEAGRQERIAALREALAEDSENPETLSALADAHLAGTSRDDLARAAAALQLLIALQPDRADAYERIVAAYLRAGDHANARAALTSYAERPTADPVELALLDGIIALRGEDDPGRARAAFDRFLELAPDDPRAPMIRGLRDEAAGG